VFLEKIQSGFLLVETPQGFARIDLSPRQRVYLLWTFRNFRHLSVALLNLRQRELVDSLFRNDNGVEVMPDIEDSELVIGVVENFVSSKQAIGTPLKLKLVPAKIHHKKTIVTQPAAIAPRPNPVSQPEPARSDLVSTDLKTTLAATEQTTTDLASTERATTRLPMPLQPTTAQRNRRKLAITRLATAVAALCLCVGSVAAWYRTQGLPVSQASNQQLTASTVNSPNFSKAETRTNPPVAQNLAAAPVAATSEGAVAPQAAFEPASMTAAVPNSIPTPVATAASSSNQAIRLRDAASNSELPVSGRDSGFQASRAPLYSVYPDYSAIRARGAVSLRAGLDPAGKVNTVKLISGNRALAAAAIRAVRQWRYRPYLQNGAPVATETYIVISFISDDVVSMSYPPSFPDVH
jgi:TonB family protein